MIYGRVIGNELRDVPPEYLPIWGQRWSGYRAPHGPSPFSTRIFSVDRMSEVGPALTSPTQFEVTLTEEDEGEDASPEPSRLCSTFPSPPTVQRDATDLTSQPEGLAFQTAHRSWSHLHASRVSEPLLRPLAFHRGALIDGGRAPFESDHISWDADQASARVQPRVVPHRNHILSGQIQHTLTSHSISDRQFTNAPPQSPTYPASADHLLQQFQGDDRTRSIPTPPPSSSSDCTIPLPQQSGGADSSWYHIPMTPDTVRSRVPVVAEWSPVVSSDASFSGPLRNSGSSLGLEMPYHIASDYQADFSYVEGTFDAYEGCALFSQVDEPATGQFSRMTE